MDKLKPTEKPISTEDARGGVSAKISSGNSLMPMLVGGLVLVLVCLAVVTMFV